MTDLSVIEPEPLGDDIIRRLEEALEEARAGKVSSIAIALVFRDGTIGSAWSPPPNMTLLIGSVQRLLFCLCKEAEHA